VPTIFIADDSEQIRRVLRNFFAEHPRFSIVGEAPNYAETLRLVTELKPDVVLADIRMPGANADETGLARLVAACECPVVAMSFTADAEARYVAATVGAARLVDKTRLYDDLIPAIDEVLAAQT
jgi:DNA-binding NarL/FixJ family response regulator